MAQADYVISANPTGLAMRTEVNQIFQAILTSNAGTVAPSTVSAGMLWGDMSNSSTFYLKIRNHTNDGWNDLYAYDVATKTIQAMANGSTVSALLSAKANLASPTFTGTVVLPSTTSIGTVSNTEIGYLDGVTSAIQTQLGTKANLASPTFTGTPLSTTAVVGTNTTQIATTAFVITEISNDVGVANSGLVKTALNASGTAPIYACRAWVNFNGTGTVAIRASGNVSSITDDGVGNYTVNFTIGMPDINYNAVSGGAYDASFQARVDSIKTFNNTTTSVKVHTGYDFSSKVSADFAYISISIFR